MRSSALPTAALWTSASWSRLSDTTKSRPTRPSSKSRRDSPTAAWLASAVMIQTICIHLCTASFRSPIWAVVGEKRYLDWAEEQIVSRADQRTDYGWVEAARGYGASETCALADHINICLYLGRGGRASHYEFVERAVLNYLPQEQFFISDTTFKKLWSRSDFKDRENHLALMRRLQGGFLCRTDPEDRWSKGTISLEGCCPPTGMTGLYQGLEGSREEDRGGHLGQPGVQS